MLARVTSVGKYPAVLEIPSGRERPLWAGDVLIGVLANRFSSTSLYGRIPEGGLEVRVDRATDLLSLAGVIGPAQARPSALASHTEVRLLGLVADARKPAQPLGLLPKSPQHYRSCPTIVIGGTASNVGKTTFAGNLVRHLVRRAGLRVGVTKLAGTGRLGDLLQLSDAGAHASADFVDAGLATTYGLPDETVTTAAKYLLTRLREQESQVIVAELGGDLWEAGIPALLDDPELQESFRCLVVIPSDTMATLGAAHWLRQRGIECPVFHGMPPRNELASMDRLTAGLGEKPVDARSAHDMGVLLGKALPDLRFPALPDHE
ncbi:hypothetical protein GCM10009801_43500 [Streptomyces albiaxialis]|uniref:DUF1611 domain-containing protein n=1 Tax=Streptomyces albiaxialis TaxID=329523 RepID=A0ABN2W4S2_9ACTN